MEQGGSEQAVQSLSLEVLKAQLDKHRKPGLTSVSPCLTPYPVHETGLDTHRGTLQPQ